MRLSPPNPTPPQHADRLMKQRTSGGVTGEEFKGTDIHRKRLFSQTDVRTRARARTRTHARVRTLHKVISVVTYTFKERESGRDECGL